MHDRHLVGDRSELAETQHHAIDFSIQEPRGKILTDRGSNRELEITKHIDPLVHDVVVTVAEVVPRLSTDGHNIRIAFREMEQICTFDPLIVLRGEHDSVSADHRGKVARYLIHIRERINDLAQSIRR